MTSRKRILFYGPLLWLRKIVVYVLITAIVLGLVVYFAANSPLVIKKVADTFAPDYNISYSRIHGNALTGIEIEDLAYKQESLAKHITLKWNPNGLVKKKIIVNTLEIEKANVDTIKTLIASFSSSDNNESNESKSTEPFDFGVDVYHVSLSIEPFVEQGIRISRLELDVKDITYASDSVSVRALGLHLDTNVTDIVLKASLKKDRLKIKELMIKDVDALALQRLFIPDSNESNVSHESDVAATEEDTTSKDEPVNPLIPKWVQIDTLEVSILPLVYDPVDIKHLKLTGRDAVFDVEKLLLQQANLDLNGSTNLSDILYQTKVKNNKLIGNVDFKPKKALFELYELPLRREAIGNIVLDLNVSEEEVTTDLRIEMKQVLKAEKGAFNLDIDNLHSYVVYDIKKGSMKAKSNIFLTTPYAKDVLITNLFSMNDAISYSGEIHAKQIIGVDAKFVKPLNNLQVKYEGDTKSIKTDIKSDNLQGTFISKDFKKAELHLETQEAIELRELVELPAELNQTKVNVVIDAPLSFEENATLVAYAKINSNVVNVDANISYKDTLQVRSVTHIPKESLLRPYSKELKWDSLNPVITNAKLTDEGVDVSLKAGTLAAKAQYDLNSTKVKGKVILGGLNADISGIVKEKISIDTKINSMTSLIDSIKSIYTLGEVPVIKGSADLSVEISELKKANIILKSPEIVYQSDRKTEHRVNDIDLVLSMSESKIVLDRYALRYADQKLFSTKPSTVLLEDDLIRITPLWINDQLNIEGKYDLKAKKGTIDTTAKKLHIAHEIIDLDSAIDIKTVLDGNKTSVKGKISLLGGNIHYDLGQKTYASDSDILIVQDMKEKESSPFMDNLSTSVMIETKKPLIYNKGAVNIKAKVDLNVYKAEFSDLMVLGSVEILEGGSYTFEGKKFVLDQSYVYFTGNPNKPLLETSVKYKSLNHLITITVTGNADAPNINFSSKPSLTKEQILSVILFDSEGGAGTNSSEDMMKMMGGAMAKSALSDFGVQLDHLMLGEGDSIEVGKKLADNITIIYVNDEVSGVKIKYEHGKRTESVIEMNEESQSYDIIYKRDF
jgi:translocation and assembly module TamB